MTEDQRRLLLITARVLRNLLYDQMYVGGGENWTEADVNELEAAIDAVDPPPAPPAQDEEIVF
jgi:hypothetical protein